QRQPVGVVLHPRNGIRAVRLVDAHGARRAHAMAVQKHHDVANSLLLSPGRHHERCPFGADTVQLLQAGRRLCDDVEELSAHAGASPALWAGEYRGYQLRVLTVMAAETPSMLL